MTKSNTQSSSPLPSLLLVDDSQEIREQMKWGLKPFYTIFEAGNREEAVEILKEEKN